MPISVVCLPTWPSLQAVGAHSEKIGAEEVKCKAMAENAQRDLDKALPALEEAMKVRGHPPPPPPPSLPGLSLISGSLY